MKVKVAMAQIRVITSDLRGNTERIKDSIARAIKEEADIVLFPETAITGYCCGSLFDQPNFLRYNEQFLNREIVPMVPANLVVVVGFIQKNATKFDGYPSITNCVAVIQGGKMLGTYAKTLLANAGHHDDRHYFTPGEHPMTTFDVNIRGEKLRIGTPICEDAWRTDHFEDIVRGMVSNGAQLILCANQSYFYYGKSEKRKKLFSGHAVERKVPVVAVNAVGVGDIVKNFMIFDGGSMAFDAKGEMVGMCEHFYPDFEVVEFSIVKEGEESETTAHSTLNFMQGLLKDGGAGPGEISMIMGSSSPSRMKMHRNARAKDKYEEIFYALKFACSEIFYVSGIEKAQVHVSGGIDSAVVLPIVVSALGHDNVVAISNPTEDNGDVTKSNAQRICDSLGIDLHWNSMQAPYKAYVQSFESCFKFGEKNSASPMVKSTIQAVGRTVQGLAACHHFKSAIVATGNHTENVLGWASFHDIGSVGICSLIGDLTKVEVFKLAEKINELYHEEMIPANLYDGTTAPAAELADNEGRPDPFDYWIVSGICAEIIRDRKDMLDLIAEFKAGKLNEEYFPIAPDGKTIYDRVTDAQFEQEVRNVFKRARNSVFKAAQAPPIVMIAPLTRGFSNRETIINKYEGFYDFRKTQEQRVTEKQAH